MGPMKRPESKPVESKTGAVEIGRRVLRIESQAVGDLVDRLGDGFDRAVRLLTDCKGRVIVTGMGKSGIISQKIAATLSSTGSPAYFLHPAEAVHGDLGMIVSGDLVIALSNSGETEEIVRLLELIRRLGARVIGISGDPDSTLGRFADVHLDASVDKEACSWDLVPTASSTAALALGDALAVAGYESRGFSPKDFATYHPGGRLARKMLLVEALMHDVSAAPRVAAGATMRQAVDEMTARGLGMTCVVDEGGFLVGILTDGDLRRLMLSKERPLDGAATEAMIRSPATIGPDALASEALRQMEDRKITSLPVVAKDGRLLGVIQIHDLWRTELF